jgi:DNA invertase Pin-like site-specific DNA recombinase
MANGYAAAAACVSGGVFTLGDPWPCGFRPVAPLIPHRRRGRPRTDPLKLRIARDLVRMGLSVKRACQLAGISRATYYRQDF